MSQALERTQSEPQTKPRRYYSDREKAEALAIYDACGNLTETSKATGIPDSTLCQWTNGQRNLGPDVPLMRIGKYEGTVGLADKFDTIAHLATDHVIARLQDPKRAAKTPMPHLMTGAGIAVDKSQLLKGLPTAISGSVMSDDDRKLKLAEIFSKLEARSAAPGKALEVSPASEIPSDPAAPTP